MDESSSKNALDTVILSGGMQRNNARNLSSGQWHYKARLLSLNMQTDVCSVLVDYVTPEDARPEVCPSIRFTAMHMDGDRIYVPTGTEILIYSYPNMDLVDYISHPEFNDVHHVASYGDYIYVVSTGLDSIYIINKNDKTNFTRRYVGLTPFEERFNPEEVDYRKINSTMPHEAHPNFVLDIGGAMWATRLNQHDIVCIDDLSKTVNLSDYPVHDGIDVNGKKYFTGVDGRIVIFNPNTMLVEQVHNLNQFESRGAPLGWCRGLCVNGDVAYVGFSALRNTKIKESIKWLVNKTKGVGHFALPTRIAAYDLDKGVLIKEHVFKDVPIDAIFSICKA